MSEFLGWGDAEGKTMRVYLDELLVFYSSRCPSNTQVLANRRLNEPDNQHQPATSSSGVHPAHEAAFLIWDICVKIARHNMSILVQSSHCQS